MNPREALKETVAQILDRRRQENDAWWKEQQTKVVASLDALAAQHEKRLLRWSALNTLWTLMLVVASALWWLK